MDTKIKAILLRKAEGIDCTEEQSAELKGFIKEFRIPGKESDDVKLLEEIQLEFPIEYGEACDEMEREAGVKLCDTQPFEPYDPELNEEETEEKDDLPMDWEPDYDGQPRTQKPFGGHEPIEKPL